MRTGNDSGAGSRALENAVLVVANRLTAHGLDVECPGWEQCQRLTATNAKRALCELYVYRNGRVRWELWPLSGCDADPVRIVLGIFGASLAYDQMESACLTSDGAVGPLLAAGPILAGRGLNVSLRGYEDLDVDETYLEMTVTDPGQPGRGIVHLSDDGVIRWECDSGGMQAEDLTTIADIIASGLAMGGFTLVGVPAAAG